MKESHSKEDRVRHVHCTRPKRNRYDRMVPEPVETTDVFSRPNMSRQISQFQGVVKVDNSSHGYCPTKVT